MFKPHIELVAEDFLYDMVMSSVKKMNLVPMTMILSVLPCRAKGSVILYVFNTLKENFLL